MKQPSARFERLGKRYRQVALMIFNTLLILLIPNLVLGVVYWLFDGREDAATSEIPAYQRIGREKVLRAYPDMLPEDVDQLLTERTQIQYEYRPFSQFRERPMAGRFINVSKHGFRKIRDQREWPPNPEHFSVFVFGGSTTFGYGIADDQTIPSYLQSALEERLDRPVAVYNFGRAYFYSHMEMALFQEFAIAGHFADLAVFIDGLNEFSRHARLGRPAFTDQLANLMTRAQNPAPRQSEFNRVPMVRLFSSLRRRFGAQEAQESGRANKMQRLLTAKKCLDRYLAVKRNIEAVADTFEIQPVFVWQPVPMFEPGATSNLLPPAGYSGRIQGEAYSLMRKRIEIEPFGRNFIWCADLNPSAPSPAYVDNVHYSEMMCQVVAERIADVLTERKLLPRLRQP